MSVRSRIVLGTLCTFNALILCVLGGVSFRYVDGHAGSIGAVLFWTAAASLFVLARHLRAQTDS